jgi:Holliday junction resolvase RusA-like endonuclease
MIELTIPGEGVGKQRPKVFPVKTKSGGFIRRGVTPQKTVNYETLIRELFAVKYPGFEPFTGPVWMMLYIYCGIPKSESMRRQQAMADGLIRPAKRPDVDNLIKSAADAMNGFAYRDDAQIVKVTAQKFYSRTPHVKIQLGAL